MLKSLFNTIIIDLILPPILSIYERYIMYRVREAWGVVHKRKIKNKGINVKMVGYSRILEPDSLKLGNNVRIGYGCFLFCKGGIHIDDNAILSREITIYSCNHDYASDVVPFNNEYVCKPVYIGKSAWIGMNVCILPGVTIGDGAIVGMGTVVSKNVEPGAIVVGASQRVVGYRDMESLYRNQDAGRIYSILYNND